ncbi:MAG: ABC transporter substrate-binding protein [Planctomycetia bacterium]|nr:ABC transporter substrate-binding protein [Planctomycetia bacterium]
MDTLKSLATGIGAIALASVILLWSDKPPRRPASNEQVTKETVRRVALLQHVSQPIIDDGYAGTIAGLQESGFVEGKNLEIARRNSENSVPDANLMAQEIVTGGYDLAISLTTLSLQALAAANKNGAVNHVFAMVTDPTAAGVGIGTEPLDHPPHLVGIGTLQPVAESLNMARTMFPGLKTLGVVWNPAEVNSEINTKLCRAACQELGITLLEANAENTAAVREAALSLISRDIDAIWIGGDVTVLAAADSVMGPARDAHIPVFTVIPGTAAKGALFDLGANYFEVGRRLGLLAGKVLNGESPAKLPVERIVPPKLFINLLALKGLRDPWKVPPAVLATADTVIDEQGTHEKTPKPEAKSPPSAASKPLAKTWNVHVLEYVNLPDVEDAEKGVLDAIRESGLVIDRDYKTRITNAQGDISTLNGMVDAAVTDRADLVITLSTPTLQAAMRKANVQPVVFTFLADPIAAGVAKSDADHAPNVTGSYGSGDMAGMISLIRQLMPGAKRLGAIFCPAEINSVYNHDLLVKTAKAANFEVVSMGVSTPAEVGDTATALCSEQIDLICLPTANITGASFPSIAQAADRAKLPVYGFLTSMLGQGATAVVARDYYDMGHDAGGLAVRVMRGEKPADIPLKQAVTSRLLLNRDAAHRCGVKLPEDVVKRAYKVIGGK